ncbi:MAG: glutamate--tRNA ligase [bacterium]
MSEVRTRFAPSPTGFLHVGSLRTALFAYLIAKKQNGKCILRIEDTDQKRKVEGAEEKIIEILDWLGLKFDEGSHIGGDFGPYVQSERQKIYDEYKEELLKKGGAYYCFCSEKRLEKLHAEHAEKKMPARYDRHCRDFSAEEVAEKIKRGEKYVVRQKMPLNGEIKVHDELRGEIKFNAHELEDQVLIKSDGMPTYHFASVVDDHLMEISHVLRGEEWIPSFPKNILLYKAFGWTAPKFIHMALTLNKDGGKLSKRQGDVTIEDFKKKGYLPETLINFSALLGWHPKGDNEIFSLSELEKGFKIENMGVSPSVFDIEKLDYLNGYYIRHKSLDELVELCRPYLTENLKNTAEYKKEDKFIKNVLRTEHERLKMLSEVGELTKFFFDIEIKYAPELLVWKKSTKEEVKNNLSVINELLQKIPEENWTTSSIEELLIGHIKAKEEKVGPYLWPMRAALTGREASPSPFEVAEVLGKKESSERIKKGIEML